MATNIIFHKVVQDGLEFGSDDTRSVSRVFFDLEEDGELHENLSVDVEEPANGTHKTEDIVVGQPQGVPETLNLDSKSFERAVCVYYQSLVTSAGYGKHLAKGKGFRSHGDELGLEQVVEL